MEKLPTAIQLEIQNRFNQESENALQLIKRFLNRNNFTDSDRILRCIIYLSEGDLKKLVHAIKAAETDWRDIILWAEYGDSGNNQPKRIRDFSKSF